MRQWWAFPAIQPILTQPNIGGMIFASKPAKRRRQALKQGKEQTIMQVIINNIMYSIIPDKSGNGYHVQAVPVKVGA